jgi:hypothetical protein
MLEFGMIRVPILAVLLAATAAAQGFDPGPYAVGFTSSIALDGSRKYEGKPRPILLDCWYPAAAGDRPTLRYAEYLRVPESAAHPTFPGRLEAFVRGVVIDDLFHKKEAGLTEAEASAWNRLLESPTAARRDAPHAPSRFPVVLYHPGAGGSFEENFLLFEYLAGHGYIVISSAFESPLPQFIGNNMGGIERSGPDFDFMAHQAAAWPFANGSALAVMGHSAGAQNLLQWIGSSRCPARAAVSLDTTMEYYGEDFNPIVHAALRKLRPPSIPVLLYASAQRHPRFEIFDYYLYRAPRYFAAADGLGHSDYISHGFLGRTFRKEANADAVRRAYEQVCRTILDFLDASLKSDRTAGARLSQSASFVAPR